MLDQAHLKLDMRFLRTFSTRLARCCLLIGLGVMAGLAGATTQIGRSQLELPKGFDGPHRSYPNKSTEVLVYVSDQAATPAILQVAHVKLPAVPPEATKEVRFSATSNFLQGFLRSFGANVDGFRVTEPEQVLLGDQLAARASWHGGMKGAPAKGVMYLVVLGQGVYCFHAFGRADVANPQLASAIDAVEVLRFHAHPKESEERN